MRVKKTRNRNKYGFKQDIRSYFTEEDVKKAVEIVRKSRDADKGIKQSQVKSAQYILDQCFGQPNEKQPQDQDRKSKAILMLPPKDGDLQGLIDSGKIKPPKGWKRVKENILPTAEEILSEPDEETPQNEV